MTLETILLRLAELDQTPTADSMAERQALVARLAALCASDPQAALPLLGGLNQLLYRTDQLRLLAVEERAAIQATLYSLETHLRQLKSFSGPATADASLLNRLA